MAGVYAKNSADYAKIMHLLYKLCKKYAKIIQIVFKFCKKYSYYAADFKFMHILCIDNLNANCGSGCRGPGPQPEPGLRPRLRASHSEQLGLISKLPMA